MAPITNLLRSNGNNFIFGKIQEAGCLKTMILFTSGATPIMQYFGQDRPALIETYASNIANGAILNIRRQKDTSGVISVKKIN